ncbi:MAG: MBL fold metallo-hydrolase, partial [Leptospirales bacterium]|nr:MBL fold metallo-hydrolase [Leptospirales bacterium]
MFLIDSGESTFRTLLENDLLDSASAINIFITHTHSDHVGSLGSLVLHAFAIEQMVVNFITGENMDYLGDLRVLLRMYGLTEDMYRFVDVSSYDGRYSRFKKFRYFKNKHCDELNSCGILFETDDGLVFYSGDMNNLAPLEEIIKNGRQIDKIYIDSDNDPVPNIYHASIHLLNGMIPSGLRSKVYCMHFNNEKCIEDAKAYGFNIVKCIEQHHL